MARNTPNLFLRVWNELMDRFNHAELADNWDRIDAHNHTGSGKGIPIPQGGFAPLAVRAPDIDNSAVQTAKLQDRAVTTGKLALAGVETVNLKDEAVTTAKIKDGAVSDSKLALPEAWRVVGTTGNPSFNNPGAPWTHSTGAQAENTAAFYKYGHLVQLRGAVMPGQAEYALTTIFTLPTGYRPATLQRFTTSSSGLPGGAPAGATYIDVSPTGAVNCVSTAATSEIRLDGIIFRAA